jgi:hypothetical protein
LASDEVFLSPLKIGNPPVFFFSPPPNADLADRSANPEEIHPRAISTRRADNGAPARPPAVGARQ